MKTRHLLAALCASVSYILAVPALAAASPTIVDVRIEGATETLFEGPLAVEPHGVSASSDTDPKLRPCDGLDPLDPGNLAPAPTPTASAADAMALVGETFDGKWYPGFDDYFITRFGPDRETEGKSWGILVNNTFTSVGGCQYQLDGGDEVLWVFDAFDGRPNLALFPQSDTAGPRPLTATAALGRPFGIEVVAFDDSQEDLPPAHPGRSGSVAYPDAEVAPVITSAKGFERVDTADPTTVVTNSEGKAQITFATSGWHRIKATVPGATEEEAIRSNRLDVCVPPPGQSDCGALPAEDQVRVPPLPSGEEEGEDEEAAERPDPPLDPSAPVTTDTPSTDTDPGQSIGPSSGGPGTAAPAPGALRVSVPKVDRAKLGQGRLGVSWKVLEAGAGPGRWTIASQTIGRHRAPYVQRASGTTATSASLRLPRGHTYRLRLTIADADGQSSELMIGTVVVPDGRRG